MKSTIPKPHGRAVADPYLPAEIDLNNAGFRYEETTFVVNQSFISYDEEWIAFYNECKALRRHAKTPQEYLPRVWNAPHG